MPNFSQKAQKTYRVAVLLRRQAAPSVLCDTCFRTTKPFADYQSLSVRLNCDKQNFSAAQPTHNQGFATAELFRQPKRWRANRRSVYVKALRKSKTRKKQKTFSDKIASNQTFVSRRFFPTIKIIRQAKLLQQAKPRERSFFCSRCFFDGKNRRRQLKESYLINI